MYWERRQFCRWNNRTFKKDSGGVCLVDSRLCFHHSQNSVKARSQSKPKPTSISSIFFTQTQFIKSNAHFYFSLFFLSHPCNKEKKKKKPYLFFSFSSLLTSFLFINRQPTPIWVLPFSLLSNFYVCQKSAINEAKMLFKPRKAIY